MIKKNDQKQADCLISRIFAGIAICLFLFSSCTKFKNKDTTTSNKVIARAFDKYLNLDEIRNIVPKGTSKNDSITIIRNFVEHWVQQQVVLKKANENLDEDMKNVEQKLEDYRNSLIAYIYERELIRQKLDTSISENDIEKYYNENANNFQLKDNIIKVIYFKIPKNAPKIDKVKIWVRSENPKDRKQLEEYCYQFATDYYFNEEEWLLFDDLLKKVPIETYDKEQFLKNNRLIEIPDSNTIYFINIKGFKIKESLSPLSFEKDNIRNLIINKRKLDLINDMQKAAYENALKENEVEIWLPKK